MLVNIIARVLFIVENHRTGKSALRLTSTLMFHVCTGLNSVPPQKKNSYPPRISEYEYHGWTLVSPQKWCVDTLPSNMMILNGGTFGSWSCHESKTLMMEFVLLLKKKNTKKHERMWNILLPLLLGKGTVKRCLPINQKEDSCQTLN